MSDAGGMEPCQDESMVQMTPEERTGYWARFAMIFALGAMPLVYLLMLTARGHRWGEIWGRPGGRETLLLPLWVAMTAWIALAFGLVKMFRRNRKYGSVLPVGQDLLAFRARMKRPAPRWQRIVSFALVVTGAVLTTTGALESKHTSASLWVAISLLWIGAIVCTISAFPPSYKRILSAILLIFGRIGYVKVSSPELERRILARYQTGIDELLTLGFGFLFYEGETFSIFRLLLGFPALVLLLMWRQGEVIAVHRRTEILFGQPIFASGDGTAYATLSGLGVQFRTRFQNSAILKSTNYGDGDSTVGTPVWRAYSGATIGETWAAHRQSIQTFEAQNISVQQEISWDAHVELVRASSSL